MSPKEQINKLQATLLMVSCTRRCTKGRNPLGELVGN